MTLLNTFRSTSIFPNFLWYDFGDRRIITGYGQQLGLRNTAQNTGVVWWFPFDLVLATVHDLEPDSQTEKDKESGHYKFTRIFPNKYFGSAVETPPPAPGGPPPVIIPDPPPVDPPPVTPPVTPTTYKIKAITHTKDFPTIVFFGMAVGLSGKLVSPDGKRAQSFVTGGKPEFGAGGTEAGAGVAVGDYTLIIGGDSFTIPMAGQWTKIEFELNTDPSPIKNTILESVLMSRDAAVALLQKLNQLYDGIFRIE